MMTHMIGKISLNVSLVLYFINYAPQIIHNQIRHQLSGLSFYFHYLLLTSCIADLIYGVGLHMPWQYRLVSISGVLYLLIQHSQIKKVILDRSFHYATYFTILIAVIGFLCLYFFKQDKSLFIAWGYLSEVAGWISCFPQIFKNIGSSAALSLSIIYLLLDLLSSVCDNISAWIFSWPTPSKLDAIFSVVICFIFIYQWKIARKKIFYA